MLTTLAWLLTPDGAAIKVAAVPTAALPTMPAVAAEALTVATPLPSMTPAEVV